MNVFYSIVDLLKEDGRLRPLSVFRFCFYLWLVLISYLIHTSFIRVSLLVLFWGSLIAGFLQIFWVFRQTNLRLLLLFLLLVCLWIAGDKAWVHKHYDVALDKPYEEFKVVTYVGIFHPGWGSDVGGYAQFHKGWKILEEVEVDNFRDRISFYGDAVSAGPHTWDVCHYTKCDPK